LGQVIGQCEALTPAPNVAERKQHKGRSPTAVFRSPSRFSGEAYTILLGEVLPFFTLLFIIIFILNIFLFNIILKLII
jgi:hypothetical protein